MSASTPASLERVALDLATAQRRVERAKRAAPLYDDLGVVPGVLDAVHALWGASRPEEPAHRRASEWFLDNEYLFRRAHRQVTEEFPLGFQRRLPRLADGPAAGQSRLLVVVRSFLEATGLDFDKSALGAFFLAYQTVAPLTIAELWALPTVLRAGMLRALLGFLAELCPTAAVDRTTDSVRGETVDIDAAIGVERTVRALRMLSELDWGLFFEETSSVDAVLRTDPAQVYERMDFATCDAYRRVVEEVAWHAGRAETAVAHIAVDLAAKQRATGGLGHVGEYLVGLRRVELERSLAYRPDGIERVRRALKRHPAPAYIGSISAFTAALVAVFGYLAVGALPTWLEVIALLVASVPASAIATSVVQRTLLRLLPPRVLPKLDFSEGVPDDCRALVAIPALLGTEGDVRSLVRQLEVHYLANPDPALSFALLTDHVDAPSHAHESRTEALPDLAEQLIRDLNARHANGSHGPFHLLHREARWNPAEERFMGWERKRGKLEELNRLLRGDRTTSYARHVGDPSGLERIRFVITLDADTQLPIGSAERLVGLLAHPQNRAVFDDNGRVTSGYTVAQPRVETSPTSSRRSRFAHLFAGDAAFDIYTHAVSDIYQDLFGSGIYVGKGIYEIDTFARSVHARAPENALASHDLFEGVHGRVALASDIVLYEDYPSSYLAYARRSHRWIRGDWQLLPWLWPRVPLLGGGSSRNPLSLVDRWKILDNLRRSLLSPAVVLLVSAGAAGLFGSSLAWALGCLAALVLPSLVAPGGQRRLARTLVRVMLLPHEAALAVDAIARAVVRMTVTHKHLLQWTTAAHTARSLGSSGARMRAWVEMATCPALAVAVASGAALRAPAGLVVVIPLGALWLIAPEVARWLNGSSSRRPDRVTAADVRTLRLLARRTWLFFETFVGPNDQWLPPDNVQEDPRTVVAHRTSPTNIGLFLLSTLSAYDLGFLNASELSQIVKNTLDTILRLERYRGHVLNWYDTRSLEPLLPRYVSSVDSGNLAGCLLALKQGCLEVAQAPVVRAASWEGLRDTLALFEAALDRLREPGHASGAAVRLLAEKIRLSIDARKDHAPRTAARVARLCDEDLPALDRELLEWIASADRRHDAVVLHELRAWLDALHRQARDMKRQLDLLLPFLELEHAHGAPSETEWRALGLNEEIALSAIPAACDAAERALATLATTTPDREAWLIRMRGALESASDGARRLAGALQTLAERADTEVGKMDFALLFDRERKLLHIGYDVTADRLDTHHYDLLASEARLASYLAIVKRDVPETHWYALGRPLVRMAGAPALLSWGGTMFEYLMPALLMRSHEGTLLAASEERAALAQIAYGRRRGVPWGVSESAFAHVDAQGSYQYQSFGVPGLGMKRGLEEDLVTAPYASFLALAPSRARAVLDNFERLERMGVVGLYGAFEAVDFQRVPAGRTFAVVRAHMAHHQGMILAALDNFLKDGVHVRRFHANVLVRSGDILLDERLPAAPALESTIVATPPRVIQPAAEASLHPWPATSESGPPQTWVFSNGTLTTTIAERGSGSLQWQDLSITPCSFDPTRSREGMWIYVRDEESGALWSVTGAPTHPSTAVSTTFHGHKAEFLVRHDGLSVRTEVAVVSGDDVEIRLVTIHNETDRARRITLTSSAEPVLEPAASAARHPAFSRMFLESEIVADALGVLFARRPREPSDLQAVVVHRLVPDEGRVTWAGAESDRSAFLGRHGDARAPHALAKPGTELRGRAGCVLDPIMAVMGRVELAARGHATLAFVTAVGRSRDVALELARRYGSLHVVQWAVRDAEPEAARRVHRAQLEPGLLPAAQHLLSAMLHPDRRTRAPGEVLAAARPCKSGLWGHGISGDDPIVLVRTEAASGGPAVREVLAIQRYLRACHVRFDVVLLDVSASGYLGEGGSALRRLLSEMGLEEWIHRRGGVHIVSGDQLPVDTRRDLEGAARVWLDARKGSVDEQLTSRSSRQPLLPRFEPTLAATQPAEGELPPGPALLFDNGFGGFTEDGREYVVRLEGGNRTPAPWCNVLANPDFGCLVSESALGSTWSLNAGENRLTPWRNDPVSDAPSEALYLRDEETAAVWSPTPLPAGAHTNTRVRHGAGYTIYESESEGLAQELTVFVPTDAPVKIARLRLTNRLSRHRRLTATYYAEWVLGTRREEGMPYVRCERDTSLGALFAESSWEAEFAGRVAFLAAERSVHGFTCDRTEFLGRGDLASPEALGRWGLSGNTEPDLDPCAALQVHLELEPGGSLETHFVLGQAENREAAARWISHYRDAEAVRIARAALDRHWDELLGAVQVSTPDPAMDLMLNRWLLYQAVSSRLFGRTGFYQSSGAFGFRDQLQDVMALVLPAPHIVRAHVLEAATHQFDSGDVLHWWHPPSGRGVRTRCSDDMLWLPFVACHYALATGDFAIMSERARYLSADPLRRDEHDRYGSFPQGADGTLLEHCRRALEHGLTEGPHGLPLIGDGDWNDGMNRVGPKARGESVWLGWFIDATARRFADVCEKLGEPAEAALWRRRADGLRVRLESAGWDGDWYLRAFHDDGSRIGSVSSRVCRIDSIAQSWSVLSGAAGGDEARGRRALRMADDMLVRDAERVVLLLWPPFDGTLHDPGYIAAYPPGVRENGGQYTHAATWLGWAHAKLGDGDRAGRVMRLLSPILHATTREAARHYKIEPYALAGDVCGTAPYAGRGGWSWYTGAAAWMWRLGVEAIVGLRREADVLRIDPCIPRGWPRFEAWLRLGAERLHIVVDNPDGVSSGVSAMTVDGASVRSNTLPVGLQPHGTRTREVRVRLGAPLAVGERELGSPEPPLRRVLGTTAAERA